MMTNVPAPELMFSPVTSGLLLLNVELGMLKMFVINPGLLVSVQVPYEQEYEEVDGWDPKVAAKLARNAFVPAKSNALQLFTKLPSEKVKELSVAEPHTTVLPCMMDPEVR